MNIQGFLKRILALAIITAVLPTSAIAGNTEWSVMSQARRVVNAASAPILAAARAGNRIVAVGDHGVVLLSDDQVHFRQAKSVPCRSLLTSLQFLDAQHGFAAGHDGVVLATQDAGETWTLLRSTPSIEKPVLGLHFDNLDHGYIIGLYGWAMETHDGGKTWTEIRIGDDKNGDHHLFHMFNSTLGTQLISAEAGIVFRSTDNGKTWQSIATGDQGSLWRGIALEDGTLLVCGMRGHLYRSTDDGKTWASVDVGTTQSLTAMAQSSDATVWAVGMNGVVLSSVDHGQHFTLTQREQAESLTEVIATRGPPLLFSMAGPLVVASAPSSGR